MFDLTPYTIGWICAIPCELTAARLHLDNEHPSSEYEAASGDINTYIFGNIGKHYVVIATLSDGEYGLSSAATVAKDMIRSIPNLKIGLMVGIGGGAPLMGSQEKKQDIRLGDVVVSRPENGKGGVYQFDYGKTIQNLGFIQTGHLNSPPQSLRAAASVLKSDFELPGNNIEEEIEKLLSALPAKSRKIYVRPDDTTDRLYKTSYVHADAHQSCLIACDRGEEIIRDPRDIEERVSIHYGLIASSNSLIKNAEHRESLAREHGILCFEMEAAGLMNQLPFLVVRGICDYSDTHGNKEWQGYAAMTAAAYAKKLLLRLPLTKIVTEARLSELRDIKEQMGVFVSSLDVIQSDLLEHTRRSLEMDIKRWLAAPNPEINYTSAKDQREPGTGKWLVESETYLRWKAGAIRHLWLHSKAGCGKSVTSASVIENVRSHCTSGMGCAIFYFTFSDYRKQSHIDCLRSVIYQLSGHQSVSSSLEQLYKRSKDRQEEGSRVEEGLHNILVDGVRSYEKFFLILDALDESVGVDGNGTRMREKLLNWLGVLSVELPMLQILATSRRLPDIEAELTAMNFELESMITEYVNTDIYRHQQHKKKMVQDTLTKADGMFRWAVCQMNDLKKNPSTRQSHLEEVLKNLPASLDETYNRMINNISPVVRGDALVLLRWLAYSHRPLALAELSEARIISLKTTGDKVAFNDRGGVGDVLRILPGLISIIDTKDKMQHQSVQLAHFSVREYLETTRESIAKPQLFHFEPQREHQLLSHCCVLYLMHYANAELCTKTSRDLEEFPLLKYAASSWYSHCRDTDDTYKEFQFLQSEAFSLSLSVHDPEQPHPEVSSLEVSNIPSNLGKDREALGLYYAVYLGLSNVAKKLIEAGIDINAQSGRLGSALQVAAYRGFDSIVKMLIEAGAEINAQFDGHYSCALQAAAGEGRNSTIKILIEEYGAVSNLLSISYSGSGTKGKLTVTFQGVIRVIGMMAGKKRSPHDHPS